MITYEEFIQNILDTRGRFNCGDEYHERHHIVPKCMDGTDDEENLIDLFAREHFIAHKLLAEENPNNEKLFYAYSCMAFVRGSRDTERYELTPEEYEEVRTLWHSIPKSEEHKKKIGESHIGIKPSEETKQKLAEWQLGDKSPKARKIIQYDLDGNYIRQWGCIKDASDTLGIQRTGINRCCQKDKWHKQCGGFIWRYIEEPLAEEEIINMKSERQRVRGIYEDKRSGKWVARINEKHIGTFKTKEDAIAAKLKVLEEINNKQQNNMEE